MVQCILLTRSMWFYEQNKFESDHKTVVQIMSIVATGIYPPRNAFKLRKNHDFNISLLSIVPHLVRCFFSFWIIDILTLQPLLKLLLMPFEGSSLLAFVVFVIFFWEICRYLSDYWWSICLRHFYLKSPPPIFAISKQIIA